MWRLVVPHGPRQGAWATADGFPDPSAVADEPKVEVVGGYTDSSGSAIMWRGAVERNSEGFRQTPHAVRKRPRTKPAQNCAWKAGAVVGRGRGGTIAAHRVPFSYLSVILAVVLGLAIAQNSVGLPRSHTRQGENQTLRADPDMGTYRAPDSHPGLVGRLCHAHPCKLELPSPSCQPVAGDKHLYDRRARPARHEW